MGKDDWIALKQKTEAILEEKCRSTFARKWTQSLIPILDRFVAVYDGDIDCVFWNSMIQRGAMSRNERVTECHSGWINCFFPLIKGQENVWCEPYSFDIGYIQRGLTGDSKTDDN